MMRAALAGVLIAACASGPNDRASDSTTDPSAQIDTTRVREIASFQQTGWDAAATIVIDDQYTLASAWKVAHSGMSDVPPLPALDLTRDRAMVVAAGMRTSGGYVLKLGDHLVSHDTLVIGVVLQRPGANCTTTAQLTAPAIFLAVPRTAASTRIAMSERDGPSC
ncbi:MAG: hypothetical protein ABIR59_13895 [Gemmatimonadales bacterium]